MATHATSDDHPAAALAPDEEEPVPTPTRLLTAMVAGALCLSACTQAGADADGGDARSTPSTTAVSPSVVSTTSSSPSPTAEPSPPSASPSSPPTPVDTSSTPSPIDLEVVAAARIEAEGVSIALAASGACSAPRQCFLADVDASSVMLSAGTTVRLSMAFRHDHVVVKQGQRGDPTTLSPIRVTEDGAEVTWEVSGPGTWTIVAGTGDYPEDVVPPSATWPLEVLAPTAAGAEVGVAFPGVDWTRPDGSAADTRHGMNLIAGSDHCGWEDASLLHVPWPLDTAVVDSDDLRQYVWDPAAQLEPLGITRDQFVDAVPADAVDTGFHTEHQQLWLGDDADEFAYLVADTGEVRRLERPIVKPAGILACE